MAEFKFYPRVTKGCEFEEYDGNQILSNPLQSV
jgi:hypothetical protein